jgi:hypothetical protein
VGVWKVEPEGDHQSEEDMAGGTGRGTSGMGSVRVVKSGLETVEDGADEKARCVCCWYGGVLCGE